jgi:hypothetical protein
VRSFEDLGAGGYRALVKPVDVVDAQVGNVTVVAQLSGCRNAWATAEHECRAACSAEAPVAGCDVVEFAAENVPIPRPGYLQVVNASTGSEPTIRTIGPLRRIALALNPVKHVVHGWMWRLLGAHPSQHKPATGPAAAVGVGSS